MIRINKTLELNPAYDLSSIDLPERILFFDIETTGLSPASSELYLLGALYPDGKSFRFRQWLIESLSDELTALREFFLLASSFGTLIHFNGDAFDLRYLHAIADQYQIPDPLPERNSVDLLRIYRKHRSLFGLADMKLKSVETFLGTEREDPYSGGELIGIAEEYRKSKDETLRSCLLLHNEEDVTGLLSLLPALTYCDAVSSPVSPEQILESCFNRSGSLFTVLLGMPCRFPRPHEIRTGDGVRLSFSDDRLLIVIPSFFSELKYFFPNPKDYYYLPGEDRAVHKKLAAFVDKAHRVKATQENCYVKSTGYFLPCPEGSVSCPLFRFSRDSEKTYVRYEPDRLSEYLTALLKEY